MPCKQLSLTMNLIISLTIIISVVSSEKRNYDGYKLFQISTPTPSEETKLQNILEKFETQIWHQSHDQTDLLINPQSANDLSHHLYNNHLHATILDHKQKRSAPVFKGGICKRDCEFRISFDRYLQFDEIDEYLDQLSSKYPIVSLIDIGLSYEGRKMRVIKISKGNRHRPAILIDGGIHAREWIAPAQVLFTINQLVQNSSNVDLIEDIDWYFLPVLNPDGYEYTFTHDRYWRKTRSYPQRNDFCTGVDLNRNWDHYHQADNTSRKQCSEVFSGDYPFSEMEAQNYRNFIMSISDSLKLYISFHNYGEAILYPWGYGTDPLNEEELHQLGEAVTRVMRKKYKVGSTKKIMYLASGQSMDWVKSKLNVPLTYTVELPGGGEGGFDLEEEKILGVVTDMFKGIRVWGEYVLNNYPSY